MRRWIDQLVALATTYVWFVTERPFGIPIAVPVIDYTGLRYALWPPRAVLWGARERDWQIGSVQDRRRQQQLNAMARHRRQMVRLSLAFRDSLGPTVRALNESMRKLNAALEKQQPQRTAALAQLGRDLAGNPTTKRRP